MTERIYHYDMPALCPFGAREIHVQKACLDLVAKVFPRTRLVAIPNGQKRTRWQAANAKAEGMSKGFPDLIAVGHKGRIAFIELKAMGNVSAEQHHWLTLLTLMGHQAGCFRSVETLRQQLVAWGFK